MNTKFDFEYSEKNVYFLISHCSLNKKYSFSLNHEQVTKFLKRLREIEQSTWKTFSQLPRKGGLTVEKKQSRSFDLIDDVNVSGDKELNKYYFHFRVEKNGKFRVFGYQYKKFFYITHIDPKGSIHHK